ncbi:MAG TPA: mechanosensitive ion channel [Polyangiaceae bacterium]|nr:mechanosensitive ion channel [Polyangiaceae bacterium]
MTSFDLMLLLAGAAALAAVLLAVRAALTILPLAKSTRDAARRALPMVTGAAVVLYALVAVSVLFSSQPVVAAIASVLVLGGFVIVSWNALHDVANGIFLKAGDVCQVGDHVRIDDLHGRIIQMRLRVLVLETSDGDEALIPYSRIADNHLLRTPAVEGVTPHVFRLPIDDDVSPAELKSRVRRSAMLVHWSAISRPPEVILGDGHLEVTVYAIDPDRGPDIEAAVRRDLNGVAPRSRERVTEPPSRRVADEGR